MILLECHESPADELRLVQEIGHFSRCLAADKLPEEIWSIKHLWSTKHLLEHIFTMLRDFAGVCKIDCKINISLFLVKIFLPTCICEHYHTCTLQISRKFRN